MHSFYYEIIRENRDYLKVNKYCMARLTDYPVLSLRKVTLP